MQANIIFARHSDAMKLSDKQAEKGHLIMNQFVEVDWCMN